MSEYLSLHSKTAVITGAGKGIGRSIAMLFAEHGARVHILDVDSENGSKVVDEITGEGGKAWFYQADVSVQKEMKVVFETVYRKDDRLDILVNNAGIAHIGSLEETSEEDFDRVYAVNVKGVYNCSLAAMPYLKQGEGGVILNMASAAAVTGIADRFAYSSGKGAVLTMTYSIAKDYIRQNIRCNAISPARVHTSFVDGYLKSHFPGREKEKLDELSRTQPIGRMGTPGEIAALALFLCSDDAKFITGSNYPVDGGFTTLNT